MSDSTTYTLALSKLRAKLTEIKDDPLIAKANFTRDQVLAAFSPVFTTSHSVQISEEEFKSFLLEDNNKHWSGLHRQGNRICADMPKLRSVLAYLLDDTYPIADRLDKTVTSIVGMGKAIITAILLVAFPDKYGVWNGTSESALKGLGLWPEFSRGETFGNRYVKINDVLARLKADINLDLWTLDVLLGFIGRDIDRLNEPSFVVEPVSGILPTSVEEQVFGMERHLHDFLRDNWSRTALGKEWNLYAEPGDPEAGYEYPTEIGRIDLLARHKDRPEWLVIELKRSQTSDQTVGQVLRYIGWVRRNLAAKSDRIRGLIIAHQVDDALMYAASEVPNLDVNAYEVSFTLHPRQLKD